MRVLPAILFFGGALICFGLGLALTDEGASILSGKAPTISALTATAIAQHPHLSAFFIFVAGAVIGSLLTHFTNWRAP